jgi:hypothetical protein
MLTEEEKAPDNKEEIVSIVEVEKVEGIKSNVYRKATGTTYKSQRDTQETQEEDGVRTVRV